MIFSSGGLFVDDALEGDRVLQDKDRERNLEKEAVEVVGSALLLALPKTPGSTW